MKWDSQAPCPLPCPFGSRPGLGPERCWRLPAVFPSCPSFMAWATLSGNIAMRMMTAPESPSKFTVHATLTEARQC